MIEYAIPSRARAETLAAKTLPLLRRLALPDGSIRVFVAEPEIPDYRAALPHTIKIERGAVGMCAQRNAIHEFYGEGARFITIDDDMRDLIVRLSETRSGRIEPEEWHAVVHEAFRILDRTGGRLWGLYPVPNPYFMKPRVRTDLSYIGGGLWGCINRLGDGALRSELEYRDDWERSVKCYLADGVVVRFDYVSWLTEGYHGAGGMQTGGDRTKEASLRDCRELARRFPRYVTLNLTKKSGWPEVRLRDPDAKRSAA